MPTRFPTWRAFLIRFDDQSDPIRGQLTGQMEHVRSGKKGEFTSFDKLRILLIEGLRDKPPRGDDPAVE